MLFPGLFGGALLVFRNWISLLTVAGVNSTLLAVYLWLGRNLEDTWIGTPLSLWFAMTLVTMAGAFWSWRRQVRSSPVAHVAQERPSRSEQVILWISSLAFLGAFLFCWLGTLDTNDPTWKLILVFAVSFSAGTLYVSWRAFLVARQSVPRPGLPTEGIILWSMMIASTCLAAAWPVQPVSSAFQAGGDAPVKQKWLFVPPGRAGFVVSSCLIHGDRLYVAAALRQGADTFGALYCLDAETGEPVWPEPFDHDGEMKQVFSTPCIAGDRLYIGEGFHEDKSCNLFCLDAKTGKKIWQFPTTSHTESSPCVAGGKVFFGAGDDGVYCLTPDKKKVWQYPGKKGDTRPTIGISSRDGTSGRGPLKLHVDASPLVVGNRVYVGSGVDRDAEDPGDPAVFCLDAETGQKIWLKPLLRQDLPAWGSPVAAGNQVFFGLGNGDILEDTKGQQSAGALLCVAADTGKELWRYPVANGVLKKPLVVADNIYFGCRDGTCYCLDRKTGRLRWKNDMESPIVTSPTLFHCPHCGTQRLYVLGSQGRVRSLDPDSGLVHWTFDLGPTTFLASSPQVAVSRTPRRESRRLYFGAGMGNQSGVPGVFCLEDQ
jgi:outer membrane protein assembly factor BamB